MAYWQNGAQGSFNDTGGTILPRSLIEQSYDDFDEASNSGAITDVTNGDLQLWNIPVESNGLQTPNNKWSRDAAERRRKWLHAIHARRPIIRRVTSSSHALLSAEFVEVLTDLNLSNSWWAFVPSLLGSSSATDVAARAVIKAHALGHTANPSPANTSRCDAMYVKAIEALRISLDVSDPALATVGLLCLYEGIMKSQMKAHLSHAGGISAILLSRRKASPQHATPLARAALYGNTYGTFLEPCNLGIASSFDDPYWLDLDPTSCSSEPMTTEAVRLRKLSNQLLIRLPGLIAKVRSLRQQADAAVLARGALLDVVKHAVELLRLRDNDAETALLHRVSVRSTVDAFDKAIVPYSFKFQSLNEKETLLLYWGARLMINKLCLVMEGLKHRVTPGPSSDHRETQAVEQEQERLIVNVLMCWQDGFGQASVLSLIWGALLNHPSETFRRKPIEKVRHWVLTRINDGMGKWPIKYTAADLDEESDIVAGGPLKGKVADISNEIRKAA